MRTLKSAAAETTVASNKTVVVKAKLKMLRIRVSKPELVIGKERRGLRLNGRCRGRPAWCSWCRAPHQPHQGTDDEERREVEHDLDARRLCRVTDQHVQQHAE